MRLRRTFLRFASLSGFETFCYEKMKCLHCPVCAISSKIVFFIPDISTTPFVSLRIYEPPVVGSFVRVCIYERHLDHSNNRLINLSALNSSRAPIIINCYA